MSKADDLEKLVRDLYEAKAEQRDEWADWLYANHIFVVANNAAELAQRYGADVELSRAAGMLHDIADVRMSRFSPEHEEEGLKIARELITQAGFDKLAIEVVVDDAIRYHSCRDGKIPASLEGKVLAAADALVHFKTDFYLFAIRSSASRRTMEDVKSWALKKLEKDYGHKIQFADLRQEVTANYEMLKQFFSL